MIEDPAKLVEQIEKEAYTEVRCRIGQTNGRPVIHIKEPQRRRSTTIATAGEWLTHPAHYRQKPAKRRSATNTTEEVTA